MLKRYPAGYAESRKIARLEPPAPGAMAQGEAIAPGPRPFYIATAPDPRPFYIATAPDNGMAADGVRVVPALMADRRYADDTATRRFTIEAESAIPHKQQHLCVSARRTGVPVRCAPAR